MCLVLFSAMRPYYLVFFAFIPKTAVEPLKMLFHAEAVLSSCRMDCPPGPLPFDVTGMEAGERTALPLRGDYVVEAVAMEHTVPALGFVLKQLRPKLRAEFVGAPADVIVAVRRGWRKEEGERGCC